MPDRDNFISLINNSLDTNIYTQKNFIFKDVIADRNYGYKEISLKL